MKRLAHKRMDRGEVRFRISREDQERLEWLMIHSDHRTTSELLRALIATEYDRLQDKSLQDLLKG